MSWYAYFCSTCQRTINLEADQAPAGCVCPYCQGAAHFWFEYLPLGGAQEQAQPPVEPPVLPQVQPPAQHPPEPPAQPIADPLADTFPESPEAVESCREALEGQGLRGKYQTRGVAVQMIQGQALVNKGDAWAMLEQWNRVFPEARISLADVGLAEADRPGAEPAQKRQREQDDEQDDEEEQHAPADRTGEILAFRVAGQRCFARLVNSSGGYNDIYRMDDRPDVLVRVPKEGRTVNMRRVLANWRTCQQIGFEVPKLFNAQTALQDCVLLVEMVPVECDLLLRKTQIAPVCKMLQMMARGGTDSMPDFRPDNVRFRDNGQMVLIDFSEWDGLDPSDREGFARTMDAFVRQFAGERPELGRRFDPALYRLLTEGFPEQLLKDMKEWGGTFS